MCLVRRCLISTPSGHWVIRHTERPTVMASLHHRRHRAASPRFATKLLNGGYVEATVRGVAGADPTAELQV